MFNRRQKEKQKKKLKNRKEALVLVSILQILAMNNWRQAHTNPENT